MQLSTVIGKQILSLSGEVLGYVKSVYLTRDYTKISAFVCIDNDEEEFYLPFRAVSAVEDAVIVANARQTTPTGAPCPVGRAAYTARGESLGVISDYLYGEEGVTPVFIALKDGVRTSLPIELVTVGETVILHDEPVKKSTQVIRPKPSQSAQKPKKSANGAKKVAKGAEISAREEQDDAPAEPVLPAPPTEPTAVTQTARMETRPRITVYNFNRSNLLGREVKRTVFDETGTPVVVAGERITPTVISEARRKNCLLRLAVNTLTTV